VLLAQKSAKAVPLLERVPALQAEVNKVLRGTSTTLSLDALAQVEAAENYAAYCSARRSCRCIDQSG